MCILFYNRKSSASDCELVGRGKDQGPKFASLGHRKSFAAGPGWGGLSLQVLLLGSDATRRRLLNVRSFLLFYYMFKTHHLIFCFIFDHASLDFACFSGVSNTSFLAAASYPTECGVNDVLSSSPLRLDT